jgi:hypothetical protein
MGSGDGIGTPSMRVPIRRNNSMCCTIISQGLIGYWPMDGNTTNWTTGNKTYDVSGNSNTGTLTNFATSTSRAAGKIGGAITFNGTNTYVDVGQLITASTSKFTVSAWFNASTISGNNPRLVANGHTDAVGFNPRFQLMFNNGGGSGFFSVSSGNTHAASRQALIALAKRRVGKKPSNGRQAVATTVAGEGQHGQPPPS